MFISNYKSIAFNRNVSKCYILSSCDIKIGGRAASYLLQLATIITNLIFQLATINLWKPAKMGLNHNFLQQLRKLSQQLPLKIPCCPPKHYILFMTFFHHISFSFCSRVCLPMKYQKECNKYLILIYFVMICHKVNYNVNAIGEPSEPMGGDLEYSEHM